MWGWRNESITLNQVRIAVSGSPLPLWERARVRVSRALAQLAGGTPALPGSPPTSPSMDMGFVARYSRSFSDGGLGSPTPRPLVAPTFHRKTKVKTYPHKPING